ncbi:MAG: hypothetical protein PVI26_03355 [Chitinispirillia bacterium]|jgi:hypothetical protein
MTIQTVIGILSFIAALLFFLAGYFFAVLRKKPHDQERNNEHSDKKLKAELTLLQESFDKVKQENAYLSSQYFKMQKDIDFFKEEKKTLTEKNNGYRNEITLLKNDLDKYNESKKSGLIDMSEHTKTLENEKNELAIKVEVLLKKVNEIESLRKENEELKIKNKEFEIMRSKVHEIEAENAALRSKGLIIESISKPETLKIKSGLSKALGQIVKKLTKSKDSRGVVVADELGLPVAGTSNNLNALAGMAAIFSIIDERIHTMLSLGKLEKLIIVDENNLTLTIFPFTILKERLMLTTLTLGSGPETSKVLKLISKEVSDSKK